MKIKIFLIGLIDILFPSSCLICRKENTVHRYGICENCFLKINYITPPFCQRCGIPFPSDKEINHLCQECLISDKSFTIARSICRYEGCIKEALSRFKYNQMFLLGKKLGEIMAVRSYYLNFSEYELLIPVPLHPKKLKKRGFNQAAILAKEVSKRHQILLDLFSLCRNRDSESQTNLTYRERKDNVKDAFSVKLSSKIKGKNILLIDDVYTTGATVNECSKVLLRAGAKKVDVLTLARAI